MDFVIIEQDENNEAYITYIKAKDTETVLNKYNQMGLGVMVILTEEAFGNMCLQGCGVK